MIIYTAEQLFDILAEPTCHRDVIEVEHYVRSNWECYAFIEVLHLIEAINLLHTIYINS